LHGSGQLGLCDREFQSCWDYEDIFVVMSVFFLCRAIAVNSEVADQVFITYSSFFLFSKKGEHKEGVRKVLCKYSLFKMALNSIIIK
jgi:hypothetical protein